MPLLKAILAQAGSWLVVLAALRLLPISFGWPLLIVQPLLASVLARRLGQARWWIPIHLAFTPAAAAMATLAIPSWAYLVIALLMGLVFWGTVKGDVPLFLSSHAANEALKTLVDRERATQFIDLGAGLGTVTVALARHRPSMTVEAWERAPIPWLITQWRSQGLPNALVYRMSFWECDLSIFDVVFAFLSPAAMPRLGEKARREMKPGSLLVSSNFPVPDWEPESVIEIEDRMQTRLYCYRMPR